MWLSHVVPYPPRGGVLQRSYHLLSQLAQRHQVDLWALIQPEWLKVTHGSIEAGLAEAGNVLSDICGDVHFQWLAQLSDSRWASLARASAIALPGGYTANWLNSRHALGELSSFADGRRYDALHVDTISLHAYRQRLGAMPATLTHHNVESAMMARRAAKEANPWKRRIFGLEARRLAEFERRCAHAYEVHILCSELDRQRLEAVCGPVGTAVVPNPVDTDYFRPDPSVEQARTVVFAGNLSWYPNRDAMLHFANDIWPLLRERVPDLAVDVIGAHAPPELRAMTDNDGRFRVHGFVDDVRPYIARAIAYICPIRDGGGTKLKILDALAMGKAIVAYPIACEGIDVVNGRSVVLAEDPGRFSDAVAALVENAEKRRAIELEARTVALCEYSTGPVGAALADLYDSLGSGDSEVRAATASGMI